MFYRHSLLVAWGCVLIATSAQAAVVGVTGSAAVVAIPANVAGDVFESDTTIAIFNERQGVKLSAPLTVDATQAKSYATDSDLNPSNIAAGTTVNSYLVHFDRVGDGGNFIFRSGSVTFDSPVLGLISTRSNLIAADSILGAPGTTYGTGNTLGIDFDTNDTFQLSADLKTVSFNLGTSVGEDHLRVVTAVPEPASVLLLLAGIASLFFARHTPRRTRCV